MEVEPSDSATTLTELGQLWNAQEILEAASVEFSHRMTSTLGRCLPERNLIRLNQSLINDPDLLHTVLCHELAHLVAHHRTGGRAKPHGPEWRRLVTVAGKEPSIKLPTGRKGQSRPPEYWEHRCSVCQTTRIAKTPARRWRCAECSKDGLDGALEVTRIRSRS